MRLFRPLKFIFGSPYTFLAYVLAQRKIRLSKNARKISSNLRQSELHRDLLELLAIAHGNVQGVGFRATARELAEKRNLKGYAKNLSDGSVEICVQGNEADLKQFLEELQTEFGKNYISKIETFYNKIHVLYEGFKILR